jgi:probable FeS assembly SUF system protein SufT
MARNESVKLKRDCEAAQIPSGFKMMLPAGSEVRITQSLGGAYTVITEEGMMVRIAEKDADALGKEIAEPLSGRDNAGVDLKPAPAQKSIEDQVWAQLRTCYDPEIPVNIADLGLIYLCRVSPLPEGGNKVEIKMTLTAPGCGMGEVLRADVEGKVLRIPGIKQADVQLTLDPPWDQSRMSEAAKLQLGML